jgi:hypothetical protein
VPFPTSEYLFGAANLFETDCFSGGASHARRGRSGTTSHIPSENLRAEYTQWRLSEPTPESGSRVGNELIVTPFATACPAPRTAAATAAAFDRAGRFQAEVFAQAKSIGVVTATGVELPVVSAFWPNSTAADLYEGTLQRLVNLRTPADYFWLWTSENWEWAQVNVGSSRIIVSQIEAPNVSVYLV